MRTVGLAIIAMIGLACATAAAQEGAPIPLVERARGAERIILGQVASVSPVWRVNEFGDRLIVSIVRVTVDETLKGNPEANVDIEVEGGTIEGVTLHVSDLQSFAPGDRAIFYLSRSASGAMVPHLRGQGTLRLDRSNRVPNSSLTLDEIRRTVAEARAPR